VGEIADIMVKSGRYSLQRLAGWVFYPWLLTLYPIIYLYSVNLASIREDDVLEVVLVALAAVTVIYAVLYLMLRDPHKTGGVTGIMVLVFLTYGHIHNSLDSTRLGQDLLMPVMLLLAAALIYFIVRSKTLWQQLTPYLNLIIVVLLLMPLWSVVDYFVNTPPVEATALANPLERVMSAEMVNNSPERPDIYYIILDGYPSNSLLMREYGYDNSDFTDALEDRGLFVAYDSQANYGATLLSLSSSMNMRYITDADREFFVAYGLSDYTYLRSLIANGQVADTLKQLGYYYTYILSGFLVPSILADENIAFYPEGTKYFGGSEILAGEDNIHIAWTYKQPFWSFFLETTLLQSVASRFDTQKSGEPYPVYSPEIFHSTFDELKQIPAREEATFTLAHILKPHFPIQFDREGNLIGTTISDNDPQKADYFFDELHYLNTRVLELIDTILAESSVPPIIIIQGDHGSNLGNYREPYCLYDFEILNAFYLPGDSDVAGLDRAIRPVNTFRMIFNHYFDGNYETLESRQYLMPNKCGNSDLLTMVRYMDDERLNVGLGDPVVLLYNSVDEDDRPEFLVYTSDDGEKGELLFTIPYLDVEPHLAAPPEQNTLITQQGLVALFALTTGEFQFNIGPDAEGREWAVIVDSLPAKIIYGYEVGVQ
jgi:hypothetical protein